MERHYTINQPSVVSETIDGEVVIVNLLTGHYFSAGGTGSLVWEWLGQGALPGAIARALSRRYAVDEPAAEAAVGAFLADLLTHELLRERSEAPAGDPFDPTDGAVEAERGEWVSPTLEVYQDMKDLLLLDPVHDVDEAGWPMPKQPDTPVA